MSRIRTAILALLAGFVLAFTLASCSVALPGAGGPSAPCSVTVSKQAADRFIQRIQSQSTVKGKTVTLTATSQEISSLLDEFIQTAKQNTPGAIMPLEKPVVCFKNGQMSIFGIINPDGNHPINALLSVDAGVSNGKATFSVQQVDVGSFSLPSEVGSAISGLISEALNTSLAQLNLLRITIQENQISLTGTIQ